MSSKHDKIIVLGCGTSMLSLTELELKHIREYRVVIGMNKYMAFYKKMNIIPTHVYLVDTHENSSTFLNYILGVCIKDELDKITFVVDMSLKNKFYNSKYDLYLDNIRHYIDSYERGGKGFVVFLKQIRKTLKLLFTTKNYIGVYFIKPKNCFVEFISRTGFLDEGTWAKTLDDKLFHYRTSFTSLLNYISIKYPGKIIELVGTDFNSSDYFFQKELDNLNISWKDFTSDLTKKYNSHFSVQDYKGTNLFDKMEYIIQNLNKTNNNIYCCNPESLLVQKGLVPFKNLLD